MNIKIIQKLFIMAVIFFSVSACGHNNNQSEGVADKDDRESSMGPYDESNTENDTVHTNNVMQ